VGKDKGNYEAYELRKRVEEQAQRIRELENGKSSKKESINRDLMEQLNEADS